MGCDIILEMYQAGELQTLLAEVAAKTRLITLEK
ncbi:glutaredoxin-like protein [Haemophilus influenzae]|uniref:Glutaredoxin-like protein n=1 Tax=Haemophilus influenzae TaxID=727 RepID=A0A2X1Q0X0_HAEIF|nr:glutaredoxin-like protein [Haemophilus influenzae]